MTLIVGASHRGRVWLAGDSLMSDKRCRIPVASPKVWTAAGGAIVLGLAGSMNARPALRGVPWETSAQWLEREAPGEIRTAYKRAKLEPEECDLLIGTAGRFWHYDTGQLYETADPFAAIGVAEPFALGWLAATRTGWDCAERLRACVKAAAVYCPAVGGRTVIVHTR